MAATQLKQFRPNAEPSYWVAPNYADMLSASAAIGDYVKVISTGIIYLKMGFEDFVPVSDVRSSAKAFYTHFADGVGKALADTAGTVTLVGSGLRIHGQGIDETDSGVVVALAAAGPIASVTTTDEASHVAALSFGSNTEGWTPASHGPLEVEALVAMSSAITARSFFLGFIGAAADAQDPAVTGSTVTLTLVQDDVTGLFYDAALTAASRLYLAHNKSDEAASIATTADGVDTGNNFPVAGTYVRLKVKIDTAGNATAYVNGVPVSYVGLAAATAVALNPILYVAATAAATKTMLVKEFGFVSHA